MYWIDHTGWKQRKKRTNKKKTCPSRKAYLEASITLQTGVTVLVMSQQDS